MERSTVISPTGACRTLPKVQLGKGDLGLSPFTLPNLGPAQVADSKRAAVMGHMGFLGHPRTGMMCPISSLVSAPSFPMVLTSTSTLQELQPHIAANSPGQSVPGSTHCQLIHCGKCANGQDGGTGSIPGCQWEPAPAASAGPWPPGLCSCQPPASLQVTSTPPSTW